VFVLCLSFRKGLSMNLEVPTLLATASVNKTVKLWNIENDKPQILETIKMKFSIFSAAFFHKSPFLLGVGGQNEEIDEEGGEIDDR
jgi:periodic tryptophan protein 1